jgi:hypothetical protein
MTNPMPATSAVARAAARHGLTLTDQAAQDIADAALAAYDEEVSVRQVIWREAWETNDLRESARRNMLLELLTEAANRGMVPVDLPSETVKPAGDDSLDVDRFEVELLMRVRRTSADAMS